jgi:hypothetical protein
MITRPDLKAGIRHLLENDPREFFNLLREIRREMHEDPGSDYEIPARDREPTTEEKVRAEVETDMGILADFFRGFA